MYSSPDEPAPRTNYAAFAALLAANIPLAYAVIESDQSAVIVLLTLWAEQFLFLALMLWQHDRSIHDGVNSVLWYLGVSFATAIVSTLFIGLIVSGIVDGSMNPLQMFSLMNNREFLVSIGFLALGYGIAFYRFIRSAAGYRIRSSNLLLMHVLRCVGQAALFPTLFLGAAAVSSRSGDLRFLLLPIVGLRIVMEYALYRLAQRLTGSRE